MLGELLIALLVYMQSFKEGPLGLLESVVQVVNCWLIWVVAFQQRRGAASRGISSVQPHTKNEIWNN